MSLPWFRMYAEFAKDPKVQSMSEALQRRLVMLFCLQCDDELAKLAADELAHALRITPEELDSTFEVFLTKGFVDNKNRIRNWNKRQYKSDVSTDRVQRHRNKTKRSETVSETGTKRPQIQIQKQSTETETEKEKNNVFRAPEGEIPPDLDMAAWSAWDKYRHEIRKPLKSVSIPAAQRKLAAFGNEQMVVVEQSIANGWTGLFPPSRGSQKPSLTNHNLDVAKRFAAKGNGNG